MEKRALEKILKFGKIVNLSRERLLLNIIKYGTYLTLLTPVVFSKSFFPPPFPPTIFFRIIVDIILIAYIILFVCNPNYRPKFNILTIVISLFLGILILTSFTGVNFEKSLWGNFDRMGGLLTFFHLFGFFIVLSNVFKNRKDWERIFSFSILVGVLVVSLILFSDQFSIKNGGTLWNSSLLASYLLFNIYLALTLFLIKGGGWRIFYGASLAVLLPTLFLSGCRGAILSFFIGLFLLILGYLIFFKRRLLKWFILGIFLISIISIGCILIIESDFIKNEFKTTWESPTLQARFIVWQTSWDGWKEKFLFGWGLENFDVVFFKYFNPKLVIVQQGGELIFDRAHNIIFDIGIASGLFGVLSYLAIFVASIFILLKTCREALDKKEAVFLMGVTVLLVVYFIQNLLLLDTINSYMMFFLILAFVGYILEQKKSEEFDRKETTKKSISPWLGVTLIMFVILIIYFGNIQPARASFYITRAMNESLGESIPLFQKSFKIHPMSRLDGNKYFYNKIIQSLFDSCSMDREAIKNELNIAEEEFEKNIKENPLDFYLHLQLASIYNNSFQLTGDKEKLVLAESTLRKAIALSPRNQRGHWRLSDIMFSQGKYKEQFELLQKVIDLDPRLREFHWYLAMAYKMAGEEELSREKIDDIKRRESELVGGQTVLMGALNFYQNKEDYYAVAYALQELIKNNLTKVLFDIQEVLKDNPQDLNANRMLLGIYLQLGEMDKAKEQRENILDYSELEKTYIDTILKDIEKNYTKPPE